MRPEHQLYQNLLELFEGAPSPRDKTFLKVNILGILLNRPPKIRQYIKEETAKDMQDSYGRTAFLAVPDEVVQITFPDGQSVSREVEIPDEEKKRWTLKEIDNYRSELLEEIGLGSRWQPIIF